MGLSDLFKNAIDLYSSNSKEAKRIIRQDIKKELDSKYSANYEVKASTGQGKDADCFWISLQKKNSGTTTQKGVYVVYLFKKDMTGFYLSLNQGIEYISYVSSDSERAAILEKSSKSFKTQIKDNIFSKTDIDLRLTKTGSGLTSSRAYAYQKGNIISKEYSIISALNDKEMEDDLKKMLKEYDGLNNASGDEYEELVWDNIIDFEKMVDWLNNNGGIPRDEITENGTDANKYFTRFKNLITYDISKEITSTPSNWLKEYGNYTRNWFWTRITSKEADEEPAVCIALSKDKSTNKYKFNVSIAYKDDTIKQKMPDEQKECNNKILQEITEGSVKYILREDNDKQSIINSFAEAKELIKNHTYQVGSLYTIVPTFIIDVPVKNTNKRTLIKTTKQSFITAYNYLKKIGSSGTTSKSKKGKAAVVSTGTKKIGLNTILYGPPGTGKTYDSRYYAVTICDPTKFAGSVENCKNIYKTVDDLNKAFNDFVKKKNIYFTTFHQSYSYEDFIEGLKPELNKKNIIYNIEPGVFKKICQDAGQKPDENFVLIIDEINRGNISKIFGELITLIEDGKRSGPKGNETVQAVLPYSKSQFSVPSNVYILGTMNTADRSLAFIDTALRRRFDFIEMMPQPDMVNFDVAGINIKAMLEEINKRIEALYDREHTIGHSFFMKLNKSSTINDLGIIFEKKIIPLLQEYFFEDYRKIQLVLGDNNKAPEFQFIKEESIKQTELFGKEMDEIEINESKFSFNKEACYKKDSYLGIYKK